MTSGLHQGAPWYTEGLSLYEEFSYAEDIPGHITHYLKERVTDLDVVDAGCSFGKLLHSIAKGTKSAVGVDKSPQAIAVARSNRANAGLSVDYYCEDLQDLSIFSSSKDFVYASWVLGTILDTTSRARALAELIRIVRHGGSILCIENATGGEFEFIRGRDTTDTRTIEYNSWLEDQGFCPIMQIDTYFEFASLAKAKEVFQGIWGSTAAQKITSKRIEHPIVIYEKSVLKRV